MVDGLLATEKKVEIPIIRDYLGSVVGSSPPLKYLDGP